MMRSNSLRVLAAALGLLLLAGLASARDVNKNAGTSAFPFLKINPGARAVGMGGAFTGLADDEMAVYYNPAGLAGLEGKRFLFEYQNYFADINLGMAGVIFPVGENQSIAGHINYLNYGDFTHTNADGEVLGTFSGSDLVFALSYARRQTEAVSLGATAKFIYEHLQDYSASGAAVDLGAKYSGPRDRYAAGIMLQNLGAQFSSLGGGEKDKLPLTVRAGGSVRPIGLKFVFSGDVIVPTDNSVSFAAGAEYYELRPVYLRLGYNSFGTNFRAEGSDDKWSGLSVGFGIDLWKTQLSYAYSPAADLGNMHRVTWQGRFK